MATSYPFKPIVTDGMVMCLDPLNYKSYPESGTNINDLTINQNNGVLTNSPSIGSKGIIFDGVNDYIDTDFIPVIGTGEISYDVWFKTDSAQTGAIINVRNALSTQFVLVMSDESASAPGSKLFIYSYDQSTERLSATDETWADNTWHHAVAMHTSESNTLYVDGVLKVSLTTTSQNINNSATILIGALGNGVSPYSNWFFNGLISNVRIYNRELTQTEVLQNYNAQKNRFI